MDLDKKATALWSNFFRWDMPQIRAFHMTWLAFFLCFFAWFGLAPLMPVVRGELGLTEAQVGWCIIASVAAAVVARLVVGWLCDRIGPRRAYTWLLILGAMPTMGVALAHDFTTFLLFRLLIGAIGASFVITQYHTSVMFAANCVGTANATSAGWGNMGGGASQLVMPLVFGCLVTVCGFSQAVGWRLAMALAGLALLVVGIAYYWFTQDAPEGNFAQLRSRRRESATATARGAFLQAMKDYRVWALCGVYGACFGIELTINNVAALYFLDYFEYFQTMDSFRALRMAGLIASLFGLMNLFARTLGGVLGDQFGSRFGLRGRVFCLFLVLFGEGVALMVFSQMTALVLATVALVVFSLFVQMAEGATFSVVPFVNRRALGAVAGLVGAGGNVGAVAAGFLFRGALSWPAAFLVLGMIVTAVSFCALAVRFSTQAERQARRELALAQGRRKAARAALEPELAVP